MKKLLLVIFVFGFSSYFYSQQTGTFKDERNGKIYSTVKIGDQVWFAENLNVDKFRNGDLIPEAKTAGEWSKAGDEGKPAWCYYNNDSVSGQKYGRLYNWYAVKDSRGLAPEGWRIPSKEEFETLTNALNKDGNALKAVGQGSDDGKGTNSSGFSALLGGYRYYNSNFEDLDDFVYFWSSTDGGSNLAYSMYLSADNSTIDWSHDYGEEDGFNVRCLKE